jgi:hypothetical protein
LGARSAVNTKLGLTVERKNIMFSVGQIFGLLILGFTVVAPGLALGGFQGGTDWSLLGWLCVSIAGGAVGGFLLAPKHRISGAIGGMIGAPFSLLALYLYSRGRQQMFRAEAGLISFLGGLPGFGVFFVLRLISDALFPAPRKDQDDDDDEDRPRRRRNRRSDEDDDEEDERPRSRRRRSEEEDEEDEKDEEDERPRSRR